MKKRSAFLLLLLAPLGLSQEGPLVNADAGTVRAWTGTIRRTVERKGTFVPHDGHEIKLDLKAYKGALRLTDVTPHGAPVNEGDVLARIDPEGIDEQITRDAMALERAAMAFRHAEENARAAREAEAIALAKSQLDAERAAKRLRGYREHEKVFNDESERMSIQSRKHRLEDQKDELDQLEKMYSEDELVDATEEIVLKRNRRNFARSRQSTDLSERRRVYNKEWYYHWREEDLERTARDRARAVADLRRKHTQAREKSEADLKQKRYDLDQKRKRFGELQQDRKQFTVRAPARGLVLHGAADAAPWSKRLEPDASIKSGQVFLTVADPKRLKVKTDVPENEIMRVRPGAAVEVLPTAAPVRRQVGTLRVDPLPRKEGVFDAEVELSGQAQGLKPGLTAKVLIVVAEERDAVLVPKSAVYRNAEGDVVRTAKSAAGPFQERMVKIGLSDDRHIAIREGLQPGEFVVEKPQAK